MRRQVRDSQMLLSPLAFPRVPSKSPGAGCDEGQWTRSFLPRPRHESRAWTSASRGERRCAHPAAFGLGSVSMTRFESVLYSVRHGSSFTGSFQFQTCPHVNTDPQTRGSVRPWVFAEPLSDNSPARPLPKPPALRCPARGWGRPTRLVLCHVCWDAATSVPSDLPTAPGVAQRSHIGPSPPLACDHHSRGGKPSGWPLVSSGQDPAL